MCKQATELQKLWEPEDGDFFINKYEIEKSYVDVAFDVCCGCSYSDDCPIDSTSREYVEDLLHWDGDCIKSDEFKDVIWLPRQDQLQKMIEPSKYANHHAWNIIFQFYAYIQDHRKEFDSLEQAWLIFVMKAKYNKIWHKEKWVVE